MSRTFSRSLPGYLGFPMMTIIASKLDISNVINLDIFLIDKLGFLRNRGESYLLATFY